MVLPVGGRRYSISEWIATAETRRGEVQYPLGELYRVFFIYAADLWLEEFVVMTRTALAAEIDVEELVALTTPPLPRLCQGRYKSAKFVEANFFYLRKDQWCIEKTIGSCSRYNGVFPAQPRRSY